MTEPPPPSRAALLWLLALGLLFLALIPVVIQVNGLPGGWGFVEVILLPAVVGAALTLRSLWRLFKRDYR
jgi:hypothetical protein